MKTASIVLIALQLLVLALALSGCASISNESYEDKVSRENDENWRRMFDPSR